MIANDREQDLVILERLRAQARRHGGGAPAPLEAEDYDWGRPHHFAPAERRCLETFAQAAAERIARAVEDLVRVDMPLTAAAPAECYAAATRTDDAKAFHVPLRDAEGNPAGLLRLPVAMGLRCVAKLLGTDGSADRQPADLSALETALLLDLAAVMTGALSAASVRAGGPAFQHVEQVLPPDQALPGPPDLPLVTITLQAEGDADAGQVVFSIRSELLRPLVGPPGPKQAAISPDETREHLGQHLRRATITVTASLGTGQVSVRDLMTLEPGDVLVLETQSDEPIAVAVEGQTVWRGRPAIFEGRYAVQVDEARRHPRLKV